MRIDKPLCRLPIWLVYAKSMQKWPCRWPQNQQNNAMPPLRSLVKKSKIMWIHTHVLLCQWVAFIDTISQGNDDSIIRCWRCLLMCYLGSAPANAPLYSNSVQNNLWKRTTSLQRTKILGPKVSFIRRFHWEVIKACVTGYNISRTRLSNCSTLCTVYDLTSHFKMSFFFRANLSIAASMSQFS